MSICSNVRQLQAQAEDKAGLLASKDVEEYTCIKCLLYYPVLYFLS